MVRRKRLPYWEPFPRNGRVCGWSGMVTDGHVHHCGASSVRHVEAVHVRRRAAAAGAVAATIWGLLEGLDRRLLRHDYSDIAVLGKFATRGPHWRAAGFAIHAGNGAIFIEEKSKSCLTSTCLRNRGQSRTHVGAGVLQALAA
jgi:hypothetical protein